MRAPAYSIENILFIAEIINLGEIVFSLFINRISILNSL